MPTKERYINLKMEQLFTTAEIARFTLDQVLSYEKSLKYYRDMKNSMKMSHKETYNALPENATSTRSRTTGSKQIACVKKQIPFFPHFTRPDFLVQP